MKESPYPAVRGEEETLDAVLAGASIARYGDGEFNHVRGRKNVSQVAERRLTEELISILIQPPKNCLVGIPTLDPKGPKFKNWTKYAPQYAQHLSPRVTYWSAFISRPDSAPWINTKAFYDKVESLWRGQRVTLVGNGVRSLKPQFLHDTGAEDVFFVECPYRDAYAEIDEIVSRVQQQGANRVLLCAGPTATVLAARLSRSKYHAIDLGHIGMFWRPYANPKMQNRPEQREINKETNQVEPNP